MGREMGGKLKKEGIYVYLWLIHVDVWQKTAKFCKAIILQKINWKKKKILLDMKKFIGKESAAPLKKTAVASIFRIG